MTPWTFVRVGHPMVPEGKYSEEYEWAASNGVEQASGGRCYAEFLRDEDMPEPLKGAGWWSLLYLYSPDCPAGKDGVIYAAGVDSVFLRGLDTLCHTLDAVDADIVGTQCYVERGRWNNGVFRIRKGSPGALAIWDAAVAHGFNFPHQQMEHVFVREHCAGRCGVIEDGLVLSYKIQSGIWNRGRAHPIEKASVMVFHGTPKPHTVWKKPDAPLHDLVREHWRPTPPVASPDDTGGTVTTGGTE